MVQKIDNLYLEFKFSLLEMDRIAIITERTCAQYTLPTINYYHFVAWCVCLIRYLFLWADSGGIMKT